MNTQRETNSTVLRLNGCTPVPLSGYLKALGVLRLVSEQGDPSVTGWWEQDTFCLRCSLSADGIQTFFLEDYAPTPILGPWGARSGFYAGASEKAARVALNAVEASTLSRLSLFQRGIGETRRILKHYGIVEKPEKGAPNDRLMRILRAELPDELIGWLDCVYVLTADGTSFPPLLGTGGNEGSGSYTSGFTQAVVSTIERREFDDACHSALFGITAADSASSITPGHFAPGDTGGANSSAGYEGSTNLNLWTYILTIEGAIAFAGASVRKLEHASSGSLAYPFCVRPAGVGYGSAALADEGSSRSEMWMPLWSRPARFDAVTHLLSEGRVDVGRRRARNGVDFARAIASVGVDRGIDSFQRFGFQQRNGLSYFAVPLGRFATRTSATNASLVSEVGSWLDKFRRAAAGQHAPAKAATALRKLETGIMEACQRDDSRSALQMLMAIGQAESAVAASPRLREADYPVPHVPLLSTGWLKQCYSEASVHATEFRLAAALASLGLETSSSQTVGPIRMHVEPIDLDRLKYRQTAWAEHANDPAIVWTTGSLIYNLTRVLNRRIIDAISSGDSRTTAPFSGKCSAQLADISAFLEGHTDDRMIDILARALMLLDWKKVSPRDLPWQLQPLQFTPSAAYALLKLCLTPHPVPAGESEIAVKLTPQIARRAAAGDLTTATRLAARRLRGSRLNPAVDLVPGQNPAQDLRVAAALVFPTSPSSIKHLCHQVLRREADRNLDPTT